jgi:Zn-dependent protease with chaperone function
MASPPIDLSFSRYVAARKGAAEAQQRGGAAYAYAGDLKVRQALDRLRPVTLAMEATVRFWHAIGKGRLLGNAVRVGERQFPRLHALLRRCTETLGISVPSLYVSPDPALNAHTFGSNEDATIVVSGVLVDHLTDDELLSVLGHECGHIHNNHTLYLTTLYFLTNAATVFVRWITQPAILALNGWARRAEVTCDRASLLATRDLGVSTAALIKLAVGSRKLFSDVNVEEYLGQLDDAEREPGRFDELRSRHPNLPKRVKAMRLFARTSYFRSFLGAPPDGEPALSHEECDAEVAKLIAVL